MASDADVLELLKSRLADMEARQRSSGSTSASDFWQRISGGMPSGPSGPSVTEASTAPRPRVEGRRVADQAAASRPSRGR